MEKFGIFELLDALSALTAPTAPTQTDDKTQRSPDDRAFQPPDYGNKVAAPAQNEDALNAFLARHDAVAHKADKNTK